MHDDAASSCENCKQFVMAFAKDSPLADWGFCLLECGGVLPGREVKRELELAFQRGEHSRVYNTKGLYEDHDEACGKFVSR
ncbi:MAG: hypothetical protein HYX94_04875 [Chloroflexi bacterium]|nr:hypothetical protein [Chloroflexota bacterium]